MYWDHMDGGPWAVMLVGWVVMVTLAIVVLLLARAGLDRRDSIPPAGSSAARRILDERLARGEIDIEEHRARRAEIDER